MGEAKTLANLLRREERNNKCVDMWDPFMAAIRFF
jgi:hypothetical protein